MGYEIDPSYKEVPQRIADLKTVHPDARLRPVNPDKPFEVVTIGERTFIVYAAACYRDENDQLPGIGVAWEPFPGKTPYTRDSELQNAETSAWGRAIVACLRSESKAIASAEDVRNRRADEEQSTVRRRPNIKPGPGSSPTREEPQPALPAAGSPDLISAAEAKRQLLVACEGDRDWAQQLWGERASNPISVPDLHALLELTRQPVDS